ncbi:diphosphomevalonate decarboxylase [Candidatus Babeliales bacterium]|nr:diphosphomevalonate decarboxylase [Candidatus Babeliales bacterium]
MKTVTSAANANIALIKYWGKRDTELNLPTKSSLSISMPDLITTTSVSVSRPGYAVPLRYTSQGDALRASGTNSMPARLECFVEHFNAKQNVSRDPNITRFLDIFRKKFGVTDHFLIETENSFPTAAGLASSASGFAALTKALDKLYDLKLSPKELSILARQGSGSACRSIQDGFVLWQKGEEADGSDSYAEQVFDENYWPKFCVIPVIIDKNKKAVSSRVGMQQTVATSPTYARWLEESEARIKPMIEAIKNRDIKTVGQLAEQDCLEMHACMQNSSPKLNYWKPETLVVMEKVKELRSSGIPCYFTIDAGPNVKVLTLEKFREQCGILSLIK